MTTTVTPGAEGAASLIGCARTGDDTLGDTRTRPVARTITALFRRWRKRPNFVDRASHYSVVATPSV